MAHISFGDTDRDQLRMLVEVIDREMTRQPPTGDWGPGSDLLHTSWNQLVAVLALGPRPETRVCPVCSAVAMRAASRCMNCWNKLEALATVAPLAAGALLSATATTSPAATASPPPLAPPVPASPIVTTGSVL